MRKYWDLISVIVLSLLLDLIIFVAPDSIIRKILGLAFVLFFPGYVFVTSLFPERKELDNLERLALSFGLSIAIVPLIGLVLNYTPGDKVNTDPSFLNNFRRCLFHNSDVQEEECDKALDTLDNH